MNRKHQSSGFTLIEVLTAVGIVGVLLAILIPTVNVMRGRARRTACANNLKQIGLAIGNYESAQNVFPVGQTYVSRKRGDVHPYAWSMSILSFMEEQAIADQFDTKKTFLESPNFEAASTVIPTFICPSTSLRQEYRSDEHKLAGIEFGIGNGLACIDYLGIAGPSPDSINPATGLVYGPQQGILIGVKGLPKGDRIKSAPPVEVADVTDGLSNTTCLTECTGRGLDGDGEANGAWVSGKNVGHLAKKINSEKPPKVWNKERIYSEHSGGAQFLMCDGSVHFLGEHLDKPILKALASRSGEELMEGDAF